ncbi:MAG: hypothetical protein K0R00_922 [Herbinix sp.]|jgi:hypothetical protein|nr:hypothetical protein [Herbinix sp.]
MGEVSSNDIKKALARKHEEREFFITECKNGPTMTGMLQFDGLAIYKSWAHPNIVGYEIKISRSDFQRDTKFFQYMPYCHELYFVVPTGLIDRMELPNDVGLIYYNSKTQTLTTKKKAIHRNIEINADMLLYIIMNRLNNDRLPFHSSKQEYFQDWLNSKLNDRQLGNMVSSKLINRINELHDINRRSGYIEEQLKELSELHEVMDRYGIHSWNAVKGLEEALSKPYPKKIDDIHKRLTKVVEEMDSIISKQASGENMEG